MEKHFSKETKIPVHCLTYINSYNLTPVVNNHPKHNTSVSQNFTKPKPRSFFPKETSIFPKENKINNRKDIQPREN